MSNFDFNQSVIQRSYSTPVLVDFWAEWCGPCKILTPTLEKLAAQANGTWDLVKVNTDQEPQLSAQYAIRSIPNCKLFSQGKIVAEFMGALPEQSVKEWIQKNLPNKFSEAIENIKSRIDKVNAEQLLTELDVILSEDKTINEASLLKARLLVLTAPETAEEILTSLPFSSDYKELADALYYLIHLLKRKNLPEHKGYLAAISSLRNGNFADALEGFISVIKEDRKLDNDGARKACVAIFKYLGDEHPVAVKFRRPFSSSLFT